MLDHKRLGMDRDTYFRDRINLLLEMAQRPSQYKATYMRVQLQQTARDIEALLTDLKGWEQS